MLDISFPAAALGGLVSFLSPCVLPLVPPYLSFLAGVTLDVRRGEFLTLFGRNGAGKTTFLKIASTLVRATHGKLRIERPRSMSSAV